MILAAVFFFSFIQSTDGFYDAILCQRCVALALGEWAKYLKKFFNQYTVFNLHDYTDSFIFIDHLLHVCTLLTSNSVTFFWSLRTYGHVYWIIRNKNQPSNCLCIIIRHLLVIWLLWFEHLLTTIKIILSSKIVQCCWRDIIVILLKESIISFVFLE